MSQARFSRNCRFRLAISNAGTCPRISVTAVPGRTAYQVERRTDDVARALVAQVMDGNRGSHKNINKNKRL